MTTVDNRQNRRRATKAAVTTMLVATAAAIAAALGAGAAHAAEPTTYVQVVYSPATGAYGEATGSASPADLYNIAMTQCQNRGGGTDCRLLHTSVNSCAALAVQIKSPDVFRVGDAPTRVQADFRALRSVPSSYILMSRCSTGDEGIG
ncbi:DUF4189 domain-containing protein [Mycobacterium deserti]|uniref:DUF4189 domain-containing protein n=1 Tax=Mycobacterium deserti TaxID=2978347 RepID=A0ABT2M7U9_9MYCO|nr:DUF4189 domain-containing protein [Mycobacterium deserti]MCT7658338.1 DUF4189 domain-containing protein [Mycobacterium deserti]